MKSNLKNISDQTIKRYSDRYKKTGRSVESLGWGSVEQQECRFEEVLKCTNLHNKSILDIGCGFGDFHLFIESRNVDYKNYIGWDINKNMISEANRNIHPKARFKVADLLCEESSIQTDIVIMLGLLNFNLKNEFDNMEYSKKMIKNAFFHCNERLIVDFLSSNLTMDYPKEDFVFYHNPGEVLNFALSLTKNASLIHNYRPIPQKEFLLVLEK